MFDSRTECPRRLARRSAFEYEVRVEQVRILQCYGATHVKLLIEGYSLDVKVNLGARIVPACALSVGL